MSHPSLSVTLTATQYWGVYGPLDLLLVWSDNHVEVVVEEWFVKEAAARGFAEAMFIERPFC
jgi:hypothetical protein